MYIKNNNIKKVAFYVTDFYLLLCSLGGEFLILFPWIWNGNETGYMLCVWPPVYFLYASFALTRKLTIGNVICKNNLMIKNELSIL
jgi:hypothetical protein